MSDRTTARLKQYVRDGGTLFASFETSLYDETGLHRPDYALQEVFGAASQGRISGPLRWDFMKPALADPLLAGVGRALIPAPIYHVRAAPAGGATLLHFTTPLAGRYDGMPEASHEPALVVHRYGKGRSVYFSGDLGASIQGFHIAEWMQLVSNLVSNPSASRVKIEGAPSSVEVVLRAQSEPRRVLVHLVNFTGEMTRPIREVVPVRDVGVELPDGFRRAYTLRSRTRLEIARTAGGGTRVILPKLTDYEVVVFEP